jgi:hypothetical protein
VNIQEAPDSSQGGYIHRPAVRLPPFCPDRSGIWFATAEAQFDLASVTSEKTRFNYLIFHLEYRHAAEVEDLIISPPANEPYSTLKTELVRHLSASRDQNVRQLLTHEEIRNRKPSQFLRHLKSLAPDLSDALLRSLWSSRLPTHIQTILAGQAEGKLDAASQLADRIAEVAPLPTIASVAQAPNFVNLLQRIDDLSRQVAALTSGRNRHRPPSTDRRDANDVPSPAYGSAGHGYCRYHQRFGDKAKRFTPPCSFRQQENGSSRRWWRQAPVPHNTAAYSSSTGSGP